MFGYFQVVYIFETGLNYVVHAGLELLILWLLPLKSTGISDVCITMLVLYCARDGPRSILNAQQTGTLQAVYKLNFILRPFVILLQAQLGLGGTILFLLRALV